MKKLLFAALLMTAFNTALFSREFVASGKTHTALGDYKIELADKPVVINGEALKAFMITYQNSPMEVKIVIRKDKKCKNYFVFSDKLSVQYVCNGKFFGVQKLDRTLESDGYKTSEAALNKTEYFHQKLIVSGQTDEVANAQLIAAYFPMLLNEEALASM
jgi:hypothetical protein